MRVIREHALLFALLILCLTIIVLSLIDKSDNNPVLIAIGGGITTVVGTLGGKSTHHPADQQIAEEKTT